MTRKVRTRLNQSNTDYENENDYDYDQQWDALIGSTW